MLLRFLCISRNAIDSEKSLVSIGKREVVIFSFIIARLAEQTHTIGPMWRALIVDISEPFQFCVFDSLQVSRCVANVDNETPSVRMWSTLTWESAHVDGARVPEDHGAFGRHDEVPFAAFFHVPIVVSGLVYGKPIFSMRS